MENESGHFKRKNQENKNMESSKNLKAIKLKLTTIFLTLVLVPLLLISIVAYVIYTKSMTAKVNELVENDSMQQIQIIDERLNQDRNSLYRAVTDTNIINIARKMNEASHNSDIAYQKQRMVLALESYVYTDDFCNSIAFLSEDDFAVYDKTMIASDTIWQNSQYRNTFYNLCKSEKKVQYFSGINTNSGNDSQMYQSVFLGYPVYDWITNDFFGVMIIGLNKNVFRYNDLVQNGQRQLAAQTGVRSIIVDSINKTISSFEDGDKLYTELDLYLREHTENNNYNIVTKQIPNTPWRLVSIIDRNILFSDINKIGKFLFIIMAGIFLAFFMLLLYTIHRLEHSVTKISVGIKKYVPGGDCIDADIEQSNELYSIVRQFNNMADRNNDLIEELKNKGTEIERVTNQRRKAELKALEAQINPHFLYNTLDSINWMAIDNDEMEISNMISSLGSLMRYSVTNIDTIVALQAEIEWMKKYIFLQQKRFGDVFACSYDFSEDSLTFPIYKMLLQPIIENTILHGFEGIHAGGMIEIRTSITPEGNLEIHINDNGCGMDEDTLKKIQCKIACKALMEDNGIGISNVVNRIYFYYKSHAFITVKSQLGIGTEVSLILPDCRKIEGEAL